MSWKSASVPAEHPAARRRDASASSSARCAKPSAAPATDVRKTSSVRIAIRNPSPSSPMRCVGRYPATLEPERRQRVRGDHVDALGDRRDPGASASTTNAVMPGGRGRPVGAQLRRARACEDAVEIRDAAVRDPGLGPVEPVVPAVASRAACASPRRPIRRRARTARTPRSPARRRRPAGSAP